MMLNPSLVPLVSNFRLHKASIILQLIMVTVIKVCLETLLRKKSNYDLQSEFSVKGISE